MEKYTTGTGQHILVHDKADCKGEYCVIHNPSSHCMRDFPTHWRADRYLMERICPHGIGHPDPDDLAYKAVMFGNTDVGKRNLEHEVVHGCDGCCGEEQS